MSTLAGIQATLSQLSAAELAELERLAKAVRLGRTTTQSAATPMPLSNGRPKVGEMMDTPFHVPDTAFAPLTAEELETWGL